MDAKSHPPTVLFQVYTPKTLAPFDGHDGGRILLSINKFVFDHSREELLWAPYVSLRGWLRILL